MLHQLLHSSEELIFLDAREQKEYQVSHIPKALWVGYKNFDLNRVTRQLKNKEQKIVVYCSIGVRSEDIAEQLMQHGYANVFNLYGGIFAWFNEKQPVYNADEKPTNRIHAYSERWGTYLNRGIKIYD
jgi:rhodanese-related sulfurtransferase